MNLPRTLIMLFKRPQQVPLLILTCLSCMSCSLFQEQETIPVDELPNEVINKPAPTQLTPLVEAPAIARVDDAQVFAEFRDRLPAVLNYFTHKNELQIINFYSKHYGDIIKQTRKYGRLTLYFNADSTAIRVAISQQNNQRQVDVLMQVKSDL